MVWKDTASVLMCRKEKNSVMTAYGFCDKIAMAARSVGMSPERSEGYPMERSEHRKRMTKSSGHDFAKQNHGTMNQKLDG